MNTRLVFAGEAIVDLVMRVPALPERGGDMLAASSSIQVGGGFNIMAAAARQGLPVVYAGGHGTGPWGDRVRAALAAEGIAVLRAPDPETDTGFDVALVEADGERTFVTSLGAETLREPGAWDPVRIRGGDLVLRVRLRPGRPGLGRDPGGVGRRPAARGAAVRGPGPLVAGIPGTVLGPVLSRSDWWSCNQREAALLTEASEPVEAARRAGPAHRPGRGHRPGRAVRLCAWRSASLPQREPRIRACRSATSPPRR